MKRPAKLYKTTIVIWSDAPTDGIDIEDLARDAISGGSFCSSTAREEVTDPKEFPDTEFFGIDEDE